MVILDIFHLINILKNKMISIIMNNQFILCIKDNKVKEILTNNMCLTNWTDFLECLQDTEIKFLFSKNFVPKDSEINYIPELSNRFVDIKPIKNYELIKILNINKSKIYTIKNGNDTSNDYFNYIISLLNSYLLVSEISVSCILHLSEDMYSIDNGEKCIKFGINVEQLIQRKENTYVCNTSEEDYVSNMNILIEYSSTNIHILKTTEIYKKYPIFYIAPVIYNNVINYRDKDICTLTTFGNIYDIVDTEPRRLNFLNSLSLSTHINLQNCFDYYDLKELLSRTRILINVHRIEHLQTFEEIRVLPALMSRVIVISEISPFIENILYRDLIIWCEYDSLVSKTHEVIENYDFYYNSIYSQDNINLLNNLHYKNTITIENIFKNINTFL